MILYTQMCVSPFLGATKGDKALVQYGHQKSSCKELSILGPVGLLYFLNINLLMQDAPSVLL